MEDWIQFAGKRSDENPMQLHFTSMNIVDQMPLWYSILMVAVLFSLVLIVKSGLNRDIQMSRTSRVIRVVGGSIWAIMIVLGMVFRIWNAYH
jgi:fumarate reductase subunit D